MSYFSSKDTHFVLELIQNADDNDYPGLNNDVMATSSSDVTANSTHDDTQAPSVLFCVERDRIAVFNNETGFKVRGYLLRISLKLILWEEGILRACFRIFDGKIKVIDLMAFIFGYSYNMNRILFERLHTLFDLIRSQHIIYTIVQCMR